MDKIYPNKEFRFTNPEYKGFGSGRKPFDDKVSKFTSVATDSLNSDNPSYMGLSNALICHNSSEGEAFVSEQPNSEAEVKSTETKAEAPGAEVNNNSSTKSGSSAQTPKAKRKRKGNPMTADAKRMVKSAAYLLEKEVGKENLAFLTLTQPGLSKEELRKINENFPELLKQFCQQLGRMLKKKGLSTEYVCISEVQDKRYKERGELALHAHLAFQSRKNRYSDWAITKGEIRTLWERLLSNLLNRSVEAPYATRIERVKKSVSKYLGKYLSKGGEILEKIAQDNRTDELPPKWDRMANSLRKKVKSLIKVPSDYTKRFIANNLESLKENGILLWYHIIEHDFGQYDWFDKRDKCPVKIVAYCGEFTTEEYMNQFIKMERPEYDYILT